jgi:hypothetical protein
MVIVKKTKSIAETGHVKNADNFTKLVIEIAGFSSYGPTASDLQLASLQAKDTTVQTKMSNVDSDEGTWKDFINARQVVYELMPTLSSRAVGIMASQDTKAKIIKDLRGIVKKIEGKRAVKLPVEPNPDAKTIKTVSAAQTSFDQRKDHFLKLISLLQTQPTYTPAEADLTIVALKAYVNTTVKNANTNVNTAAKNLFKSRKERNIELYANKTGAVNIALRVKEYVKGMLPAGAKSAEYKRIKHIAFRNFVS